MVRKGFGKNDKFKVGDKIKLVGAGCTNKAAAAVHSEHFGKAIPLLLNYRVEAITIPLQAAALLFVLAIPAVLHTMLRAINAGLLA